MSLEKKGTVIVTPAIRVTDLPALPGDVTDSSRMGKWWDDFRQVLARLIQAKSESQSKEQVVVQAEATAETPQSEVESKPVDWDDIANKPEKFPPLDHTHKTPWFQVENPLCLSEVDPDTNLATLGFYEQKAATFLAGPLSGPVAKPVFRPLYTGDDANLDGSGAGSTPGTPGTYDDLNGGTGGGTPNGSVAVQSRGGSWALKGLPEWTDPSTPPRRYLSKTMSGSAHATGSGCEETYTAAGSCVLDPATDEWTDGASYTLSPAPESGGCMSPSGTFGMPQGAYGLAGAAFATTFSRTVATNTFAAGMWATSSGAITASLSNEDTPRAAADRMLATAEWGAATTAMWTIPTTGITGLYREARYRTEHSEDVGQQIWVEGQWVDGAWIAGHYKTAQAKATYATLVGLSPWGLYQLTVTLESRPVDSAGAPTGSGEWSAAGTRTHLISADIDGEGGVDWQVVEPTAGYETRIASTLVEAVAG